MFDSSDEENVDPENADTLQIDLIRVKSGGRVKDVAISSLPGCRFQNIRHNLNKDLDQLENESISDILVLVNRGELQKYRVPNLFSKYESRGFNVHHYPIPDGDCPSIDFMMSILFCLKRLLDADKRILIHCMGGLGRACVVAACLIQYMDEFIPPEATLGFMRNLRGSRAVRTLKQYNFIHDFRDLHHQWLNEDLDMCISR